MLSKIQRTTILYLSIPLAILLVAVSITGYTSHDLYDKESLNWQIQSRGQDMVDLFLVTPLLLLSTLMCTRSNSRWLSVWAATIVYIIYSFLIYCFAVHFNFLFLFYCLILGLAFYAILYYITILASMPLSGKFSKSPVAVVVAIYLLLISVMFYGLWLSEIIPFMVTGEMPISLLETGLQTNPVHVIDLSVFLPGVFITGIMLLNRKPLALHLSAMLLVFFIIMNMTIASLQIMLRDKGLADSISIAYMMIVLAICSLLLCMLLLRKYPNYSYEPPIR